MIVTGWLTVQGTKKYSRWNGKLTGVRKSAPASTARNEIAIRVTLDLPDALFERPQLEAKIAIPPDALGGPVVNADVQDNIAAILSEQLGVVVHVSAGDDE